jgi:beta-glucosidase
MCIFLLMAIAAPSVLHGAEGAAVAQAPASAKANTAITPEPRTGEFWEKRQAELNRRARERQADLLFIGDSITQSWEGPGKQVWEKYYGKRNALNLGIGGDRTQHVLWRFDHGNLEGQRPKAAVIMIGTNNSNGEDNTVAEIADGVSTIVQHLRERLPDTKILLLGIFPRGKEPCPQRGKLLQVNQILAKLEDRQHVWYIDFGHKFVERDGSIPRSLMPDYLHLSPEGYAIWAESIEPQLAQLLGEK